jgi:hypothetical protein
MKRKVTVTFEIDPQDYHDVEDSPTGVLDLVKMMFSAETDMPDEMNIVCEDIGIHIILND